MTRDPRPKGAIGYRLVHELEGLVRGIAADGRIVPEEIDRVRRWLEAADSFRTLRPFSELTTRLDAALADGVMTPEECEDILFVCGKLTTVNPYFGAARAGIQVLMGMLAGITADGEVRPIEIERMNAWLREWHHLEGHWPFDECVAVARLVAAGHYPENVQYVFALTEQFPVGGSDPHADGPPALISGVCASSPRIEFIERRFVFTGESTRGTRADLHRVVAKKDGIPINGVTQKADYLVVCDCGSPYWAFSCHGRKVEHAYGLRREGHPILIVHESDFWSAVDAS